MMTPFPKSKRIAITGATGSLGSRFLSAALAANPNLEAVALTRRDPWQTELPRWRALLRQYGARLHFLRGDLSGRLDPAGEHAALFQADAGLWHFAADIHLGPANSETEARVRAINFHAVEQLLEGARRHGGAFHYLSTAYVAGNYGGIVREEAIPEGRSFNNVYEASKCEAEGAVLETFKRGVPGAIYRPSIVLDEDFQPGGGLKLVDMFARAASQSIRRGVPLVLRLPPSVALNLVTGDWVNTALLRLARFGEAKGEIYHLTAREDTPLEAVLAAASERVQGCLVVFAPEAVNRDLPAPSRFLDRALRPLHPYFEAKPSFDASRFNRLLPSPDRLDADAIRPMIRNFAWDNKFSLRTGEAPGANKAPAASTTR